MIRRMLNITNRRRLIHFNMQRQNLCPICNNHIYYDNKEDVYKCRNNSCDFKEQKYIYEEDKNISND